MTTRPTTRPPLEIPALVPAAAEDGWRVEVVDRTPSTNALVVERAKAGEPAGLVIVAEHQTSGRGRLDRRWETPSRAALTFSVLLRPTRPPERWPWLPLLAGCSVVAGLGQVGVTAHLKWPNDVLVGTDGGEGKLAGILVERVDAGDDSAAVIGIGINVSSTRAELPVAEATSILLATDATPDRTLLLIQILADLRLRLAGWEAGGDDDVRSRYASMCRTIGREVRVAVPGGPPLVGTADGIDDDGRLLVRTDTGTTPLGAGDVVHVRSPRR